MVQNFRFLYFVTFPTKEMNGFTNVILLTTLLPFVNANSNETKIFEFQELEIFPKVLSKMKVSNMNSAIFYNHL